MAKVQNNFETTKGFSNFFQKKIGTTFTSNANTNNLNKNEKQSAICRKTELSFNNGKGTKKFSNHQGFCQLFFFKIERVLFMFPIPFLQV